LTGRQRFDVYCLPCHSYLGDGDGMVVQRGFSPPPSFHTDRLRQAPVGHFFNVISNVLGSMPAYASQIADPDRWAIAAYIRALQLSQHATLDDVPPDQRAQLEAP
jgi:mono/diheme cytochrome c family protein